MKNLVISGLCALSFALMTTSTVANSITDRYDFGPGVVVNSFTGEIIEVSGTVHVVATVMKDGRGKVHVDVKGSGISDIGVKYQFMVKTKETFDVPEPPFFFPDFLIVVRSRLIGQGPSNNEFIITTTTMKDDVWTVKTEIECR